MDDQYEMSIAGERYYNHRADMMVKTNKGLTKTYNRFHDPADHAPDIERLRVLHAEMDAAVLRAYGWHDLAETAVARFLTEADEDDHTYQGRLLALNAERGVVPVAGGDDADEDMEVEEE